MLRDLFVDFLAIVIVVGQRIMNRGKGKMRIMSEDFFRCLPMSEGSNDNGSDGNPCPDNAHRPTTNGGVTDDMWMQDLRHEMTLPQRMGLCKQRKNKGGDLNPLEIDPMETGKEPFSFFETKTRVRVHRKRQDL